MRILFTMLFLSVITASKVPAVTSFTDENAKGRILSGIPAITGEFPFVVAIKVDSEYRCGGFIYNERWVVTAASCVSGFNNVLDRVRVEAGIVSLESPEPSRQLNRIESFHLYDSYNESLTGPLHDLALIQTRLPFIFNSEVNFSYYNEASDGSATFIGWGIAEAIENSGSYSNELLKAKVTINSTSCQSLYGESYKNGYMICTGDAVKDTQTPCHYDEGSPLVQDGFVVGVMSRNNGCDAVGTIVPTIYTRLSVYYSWLATTAGIQPISSTVPLIPIISESKEI